MFIMSLHPIVRHLTTYSNTCGGQNKNSHFAAMCMTAVQNSPCLLMIDQKFLLSGHTHMESDADHSQIEKKKKFQGPIEHPHNSAVLIRQTGKKNPFLVTEMESRILRIFHSYCQVH